MKLVGFSQGVSLATKEMVNYLDFVREDGSMFRLPVPEETIEVLLPEVYGKRGAAPLDVPAIPQVVPDDLPEDLDGATSFGDEELPEQYPEEPEDHQDETPPESEEEVPSL